MRYLLLFFFIILGNHISAKEISIYLPSKSSALGHLAGTELSKSLNHMHPSDNFILSPNKRKTTFISLISLNE